MTRDNRFKEFKETILALDSTESQLEPESKRLKTEVSEVKEQRK